MPPSLDCFHSGGKLSEELEQELVKIGRRQLKKSSECRFRCELINGASMLYPKPIRKGDCVVVLLSRQKSGMNLWMAQSRFCRRGYEVAVMPSVSRPCGRLFCIVVKNLLNDIGSTLRDDSLKAIYLCARGG